VLVEMEETEVPEGAAEVPAVEAPMAFTLNKYLET